MFYIRVGIMNSSGGRSGDLGRITIKIKIRIKNGSRSGYAGTVGKMIPVG